MERMTTIDQTNMPSTSNLWTSLTECQQEMLSGGAPKITIPPPPAAPPGIPGVSAIITTELCSIVLLPG